MSRNTRWQNIGILQFAQIGDCSLLKVKPGLQACLAHRLGSLFSVAVRERMSNGLNRHCVRMALKFMKSLAAVSTCAASLSPPKIAHSSSRKIPLRVQGAIRIALLRNDENRARRAVVLPGLRASGFPLEVIVTSRNVCKRDGPCRLDR